MKSSRLRIVADQNTPYIAAAFSHLGEVVLLPSSQINAAAVRDADVLLVRSTVKVGEALLAGSRVKFVGTATIGIDHMDVAWLAQSGVRWASSPGSNAPSVAQWWAAAVALVATRKAASLRGLVVGVVGVGNVGTRIAEVARALGCVVLQNDPPRARQEGKTEGQGEFTRLDETVARADILTLHVPLTLEGIDRTARLIGERRIAALKPGAWLINSCRGQVADSEALIAARRSGQLGALILDVFDPEPEVNPSLIAACDLATTHIAGHSLDGKAAGTLAIYQAACAYLGVKPQWSPRQSLPPRPTAAIALDARTMTDEQALLAALRRFYRIEEDDAVLRRIAELPDGQRGAAFRKHRDNYPERRELHGVSVQMTPPRPRALAALSALGAVIRQD